MSKVLKVVGALALVGIAAGLIYTGYILWLVSQLPH